VLGVKDVVRPRVKFNDDPNNEQNNEAPIPFIRVEE